MKGCCVGFKAKKTRWSNQDPGDFNGRCHLSGQRWKYCKTSWHVYSPISLGVVKSLLPVWKNPKSLAPECCHFFKVALIPRFFSFPKAVIAFRLKKDIVTLSFGQLQSKKSKFCSCSLKGHLRHLGLWPLSMAPPLERPQPRGGLWWLPHPPRRLCNYKQVTCKKKGSG